jgi:hypothetical protein
MEAADLQQQWLVVGTAEGARALTEFRSLRALRPFVGQTRTLSAAAAEADMSLSRLNYWVRRFLALGLVQVVEIERRTGSPIRHYRATRDVFFVPFSPATAPAIDAFREGVQAELQAELRAGLEFGGIRGGWGLEIRRHETGVLAVNSMEAAGQRLDPLRASAPATLRLWESLQLDFVQAKQLQRELFELVQRYRHRSGAQRYIVGCAMAPTRPVRG